MRVRLRPVIRAAGAAALAAALLSSGVAPASAVRTPTLVVENGKVNKATYGPIPGNYAATPAAVPEPSDCGNAEPTSVKGNEAPVVVPGPLEAACDTVPIKIIPPAGLGPTEDFLVTLTISWTPDGMVEDPTDDTVGDTPADDIDVYFYDNKQVAKREDPEASTWTNLGESTAFGGPETIKLFSPELVDYNLVVVNLTGPNIDYTVEATVAIDGFELPFEDLGPTFAPRRAAASQALIDDRSDNLVLPLDFSGDGSGPGGGSASAIGGLLSGGRTIDPVPVLPDADFASFSNTSARDPLAAPTPFGSRRTITRPVGEASVALVVFWLIVAPLLVLAVLVIAAMRRNRTAFSLAT